jgi:hypothetical protein
MNHSFLNFKQLLLCLLTPFDGRFSGRHSCFAATWTLPFADTENHFFATPDLGRDLGRGNQFCELA